LNNSAGIPTKKINNCNKISNNLHGFIKTSVRKRYRQLIFDAIGLNLFEYLKNSIVFRVNEIF